MRELKTRRNTVDVLQVQCIDTVMDVLVIMQRPYDQAGKFQQFKLYIENRGVPADSGHRVECTMAVQREQLLNSLPGEVKKFQELSCAVSSSSVELESSRSGQRLQNA